MDSRIINNSRFLDAIAFRIGAGDTFRDMLNKVCGVIMTAQLYRDNFDSDGLSLEHFKLNATHFELVCLEMIGQFKGEPSDFRYVFMDAWVIVDFFVEV